MVQILQVASNRGVCTRRGHVRPVTNQAIGRWDASVDTGACGFAAVPDRNS
ncbi:hypothetical protein MELE44368_08905 [Mycolicibacterium elephantis DSM 44368]|uniref:Uncharacterized protein n=1 Tax=Mycolicibacterium elephantis DSM 44368 TaxID=1335622 RepID=A0A439DLR9_9MYCO|nr:hypothetical protein MELE44368_08905 [Mycolicibacterium elephantis DSM 44368]